MRPCLLWLIVCLGGALPAFSEEARQARNAAMTQESLESILRSIAPEAKGVPGALGFAVSGVQMECISDVKHDRMRLVAVITSVSNLTSEQVGRILEANFHTALDARYATSQGYLYAAFIHPLSPLTEQELRSAVAQISTLATNFGTTYSSGGLVFAGSEPTI